MASLSVQSSYESSSDEDSGCNNTTLHCGASERKLSGIPLGFDSLDSDSADEQEVRSHSDGHDDEVEGDCGICGEAGKTGNRLVNLEVLQGIFTDV